MFISLLRGINVGGHKKIKMQDLRNLYINLDFTQVQSYIQSGNLVFEAEETDLKELKNKIEKGILEEFTFEVKVLIIHKETFEKIAQENPYDETTYFIFLSETPQNIPQDVLEKVLRPSEKYLIKENILYFSCPEDYGKTKFSNNFIENKLKVSTTTRNFRTVQKILSMLSK